MNEQIVRRGTWRAIPDDLIWDTRLTARGKWLWLVLQTYVGQDTPTAWPGIEGVRTRLIERQIGDGEIPSQATIKRAMAELVAAGWVKRLRRRGTSSLTFIAQYAGEPAPWEIEQQQRLDQVRSESDGSDVSRADGSDVSRKRKPDDRPPKNDSGETKLADEVARYVWENRQRNAQKYLAIRAVALALLRAGNDLEIVKRSMIEAPTVSIGACEIVIASLTKRTRGVRRATSGESQIGGRVDD